MNGIASTSLLLSLVPTIAAFRSFHSTDTGPTIPPDESSTIFERFHRGSNVGGTAEGRGLGIGLSLAKEIIQAHRGTLIESENNKTIFDVTLPEDGE